MCTLLGGDFTDDMKMFSIFIDPLSDWYSTADSGEVHAEEAVVQ